MITQKQITELRDRRFNSKHPCIIKGSTIIEEHDVIEDELGNPIGNDVLYASVTTYPENEEQMFYRIDNPNLIWGINTVAPSNHPKMFFTYSNYEREAVNTENESVVYVSSRRDYVNSDICAYSELTDEYIIDDEARWSEFHDTYIHEDDAIYNDFVDDYHHSSYRHEFYEHHDLRDEDEAQENIINDYHGSPNPHIVNEQVFQSGWFVGFEVEKTQLDNGNRCEGSPVDPCNFFAGWETDSSCGVEGISNIYNIADPQLIDDIKTASHIDSPTDISCGGHINISYKSSMYSCNIINDDSGQTKGFNTAMLKKYASIIYAMFPQRLIRSYCNSNPKLERYDATKYQPIRDCGNRSEVRLFSRVKSSKTLINRVIFLQSFLPAIEEAEMHLDPHSLFANISRFPDQEIRNWIKENKPDLFDTLIAIDFAYNPHMRYAKYILNRCYPVIKKIYTNSSYNPSAANSRMAEIVEHTYAFNDFLLTNNKPKACIIDYIRN